MITPATFRVLLLVMLLIVKDNLKGFPFLVQNNKENL